MRGTVLMVCAMGLLLFPLIQGRELEWPAWAFVMLLADIRARPRLLRDQQRTAESREARQLERVEAREGELSSVDWSGARDLNSGLTVPNHAPFRPAMTIPAVFYSKLPMQPHCSSRIESIFWPDYYTKYYTQLPETALADRSMA
jgi:hypothetical protein